MAPATKTSLLLGFAALAASCGRSPAARAEEARAKLSSWDATLELLAQERAAGAVPERFAEQVRRADEEERGKAQAELREAQAP
jgi:hypothetical protein